MKIFLQVFLLLLLFNGMAFSASAEVSVLAKINKTRKLCGLIPLKYNHTLSRAAKNHASYLFRNQITGHTESSSRRGFTGNTPGDRAVHTGYAAKAIVENLTANAKSYSHSLETLYAAIYHRFVFLNFYTDEIGIARVQGKTQVKGKQRRVYSAYVYDLGSSKVTALCHEYFSQEGGTFYINNLCADEAHIVPQNLFYKREDAVRKRNAKVVVYPYPNAVVPPVFFTERPHPLPGSQVSGYPVTVQFNPYYFSRVKLKKFRLYDAGGKRITRVKLLTQTSDPNGRLSALQFALMPLDRLVYGAAYRVELEAKVDGKKIRRSWSFTTSKPKGKLYTITKRSTTVKVGNAQKILLYFKPKNSQDVLSKLRYKGRVKVKYLDRNTLEVTLPKKRHNKVYSITAGDRKVFLK